MVDLLADLVLVVHALFVGFVVGGLAAIWLGHRAGWAWVRKRGFRAAHLAAIGFVAVSSLVGIACPLTLLEARLRTGTAAAGGCIQRVVGGLLYFELPVWLFTTAYVAFAGLVILTWRLIPPHGKL